MPEKHIQSIYNTLDELELPRPIIYTPQKLRDLDPKICVFLRGDKNINGMNQRVDIGTLSYSWNWVEHNWNTGKLYSIEKSPEVILGGATYISSNHIIYSEICLGHISGLLSNGFCRARSISIDGDKKNSLFREQLQTKQTNQKIGILTTTNTNTAKIEWNFIKEILLNIAKELIYIRGPYLLELLI